MKNNAKVITIICFGSVVIDFYVICVIIYTVLVINYVKIWIHSHLEKICVLGGKKCFSLNMYRFKCKNNTRISLPASSRAFYIHVMTLMYIHLIYNI